MTRNETGRMKEFLMLIMLAAALLLTATACQMSRRGAGALLDSGPEALYRPTAGQTVMANGMWIECPRSTVLEGDRKKIVLADLKGPGLITMIHFAWPAKSMYAKEALGRETLLRIYWDGEATPSVEAPLADFFCDPNGALEHVDSAMINKKRGWNCYFPMPFAKSARVEVLYENSTTAASEVWANNPCYAYVMARKLKAIPKDSLYFHATWRQRKLLLGKEDYPVFEAEGRGHFVGWSMTVRSARSAQTGAPVDENEQFFIDGAREPAVEWMGLEDGFGFSWGFPDQASMPFTGTQPYMNGLTAYRFCLGDRIVFNKSIAMKVGFGKNENPIFRKEYSKPINPLEFSSVAYWYQSEPHRPFAPLPSAAERRPVAYDTALVKAREQPHIAAGESLAVDCGSWDGEIAYAKAGWSATLKNGSGYADFPTEINYCWTDAKQLEFEIQCPKGARGTLKLYILDGDSMGGGRKESVSVAGRKIGDYENFQQGRWIEAPIAAADSAQGRIGVAIENLKPGANAVVSLIRFVEAKP
jgi:hypothetical protein